MTGPVERVLAALRRRGYSPRRSGKGWTCCCPAHDDRTPSLSIHVGGDGRALLSCHARCPIGSVCAAMGLRESDLFVQGPRWQNGRPPPAEQTPAALPREGVSGNTVVYASARAAVAELELRHGPRAAIWAYANAQGEWVGLVVRWDTPAGKKLLPVSRKADGSGWILGGMPAPRPLYALPDLLSAPAESRVYITEGEKAADAARAIGLVATTSSHGANSAAKTDWSPLEVRDVVIVPDRDHAGEQYAADVAKFAIRAGARSVRVVRSVDLWPEMPQGGDLADLLEHRGGDTNSIATELEALAHRTEPESMTVSDPVPEVACEWASFPVSELPEPIRGFVIGTSEAIGCDPSYVALPMLSTLAAAIGNTHRIELKRGWSEPPIVWTVIVGESGTHKTPAFKAAMSPIRKVQAEAFKEHDVARAEWEADHLRYEAELTAWKRDAVKRRPDDGYSVAPPEKPIPPAARRFVVSDTTTEALAPILLDNPRGVLLARDELAGWIGSFDRYSKAGRGGADAPHYLSMHNGEAMTIDRKTGIPPTIHVPSASVSITGGIQPGILARALGQEHHESGLLARMLFAMPPHRVKQWTEAEVSEQLEAAVEAVFARLFGLTAEPDGKGGERPRLVRFTEDGKRAWVQFYNEHAREQAEFSGDEAAAWSKLEGYAARLALVIHLVRWAGNDPTLGDPTLVDAESVRAGVVLARWFANEARRVYSVLSESDDERDARRLVELIQRRGGSVSGRELVQASRAYRTVADAESVLSALVDVGKGRWETPAQRGRGGPKARRFVLSPGYSVPVNKNDAGGIEKGVSVEADGLDAGAARAKGDA